jgi:GTPase SAR1 family protein
MLLRVTERSTVTIEVTVPISGGQYLSCIYLFVGNKCDLEDERQVTTVRGKQLADQLGMAFFEASAKDNVNVKQIFDRLVDMICEKMAATLDSDPNAYGNRSAAGRVNVGDAAAQASNMLSSCQNSC